MKMITFDSVKKDFMIFGDEEHPDEFF